jgi:hypothetical protein
MYPSPISTTGGGDITIGTGATILKWRLQTVQQKPIKQASLILISI